MTNVFRRRPTTALPLLLALAIAPLAGCGGGGGKTAKVAGQVTIGGKPLPADAAGTVSFAPVGDIEAEPAIAPVNAGRYETANAPTGDVQVVFDLYVEGPPKYIERIGKEVREKKSLIPPQQTGQQQVTINGDNESLDFDL